MTSAIDAVIGETKIVWDASDTPKLVPWSTMTHTRGGKRRACTGAEVTEYETAWDEGREQAKQINRKIAIERELSDAQQILVDQGFDAWRAEVDDIKKRHPKP